MNERDMEVFINNLLKPYALILGAVFDNQYDSDSEEYNFSTEIDWRDIDNHQTVLHVDIDMAEESPKLNVRIDTQKHGSHSDWEIYMESYLMADPHSIKLFHEDLSKFLLGFYEDKKPHVECLLVDCEQAIGCLKEIRKTNAH